jgi:hypothetical protein
MKAHECYHCKQWIEEGQEHDCWTTTEAALTKDLSEDLREAWERIRETAVEFGEQRIYASHNSIMFARKVCYFFVRPQRKYLEVWFFVGRAIRSPIVDKVMQGSSTKTAHRVRITHRDQVEPPLSDWLREAYEWSVAPKPPRPKAVVAARTPRRNHTTTRTAGTKKTASSTRARTTAASAKRPAGRTTQKAAAKNRAGRKTAARKTMARKR